MNEYLEPSKKLNVYGYFDVIVVGGGCAGFASAVASARNGARTLIIEQFPYFGGTATASLMASINGYRNQVEPDGLQTARGISEEVILRLKEMDGLGKTTNKQKEYPTTPGNLSYSYTFDVEKFKHVTLKIAVDAGVHILFHTYFSDVIMEGNEVKGIIFENKSGRQAAFGKVLIDASGDGDVAYKSGAPFMDTGEYAGRRLKNVLMYKIAGYPAETKVKGCDVNGLMVLWGPVVGETDCTDADEFTDSEIKARLALFDDFAEKKIKYPELDGSRICESGPLLGVRQSRFIDGEYKMTADDVFGGRNFEDSIAMVAQPSNRFYGYRRYLEHEGYNIPYRSLLPKKINNLLVVGRFICSEQPAFESLRTMAVVMCTGQAAGTSAALCSRYDMNVRDIDIKLLQNTLIEQGAEIGQNRRHKPLY